MERIPAGNVQVSLVATDPEGVAIELAEYPPSTTSMLGDSSFNTFQSNEATGLTIGSDSWARTSSTGHRSSFIGQRTCESKLLKNFLSPFGKTRTSAGLSIDYTASVLVTSARDFLERFEVQQALLQTTTLLMPHRARVWRAFFASFALLFVVILTGAAGAWDAYTRPQILGVGVSLMVLALRSMDYDIVEAQLPSMRLRIIWVIMIALIIASSITYPWTRYGGGALATCAEQTAERFEHQQAKNIQQSGNWLVVRVLFMIFGMVLTGVALIVFIAAWRRPSSYMPTTIGCVAIFFTSCACGSYYIMGEWCEGLHMHEDVPMFVVFCVNFCRSVSLLMDPMGVFYVGCLILQRLTALQMSLGQPLRIWATRNCLIISCGCWFFNAVCLVFCDMNHMLTRVHMSAGLADYCWHGPMSVIYFLSVWTSTGVFLIFSWLVVSAFGIPLRVLRAEAERLQGFARAEAVWASSVVVNERLASCGCLATAFIHCVWIAMNELVYQDWGSRYQRGLFFGFTFANVLDICVQTVCILFLSGLVTEAPTHVVHRWRTPAAGKHVSAQDERHRRRTMAGQIVAQEIPPGWEPKVNELCMRGFTLESLLHFYEQLTDYMPGFDPRVCTTEDVVRRAVIPNSRTPDGGGCSMASVWHPDQPLLAERLVTHTWSNLFLHLVAAIVADGLDQDHYEDIALTLTDGRFDEVRCALRARGDVRSNGALDYTYWVCAFSVNQHASICCLPGPNYSPCLCTQRKIYNHEPAETELNKFDHMMTVLHSRVPGFKQVIAVDVRFNLFTRAWCIAELVEADTFNIPQSIKVFSGQMLDKHYDKLSCLQVQDCEATRKEDKEYILSKIVDKDAFNEHLQLMIFGSDGLFSTYMDAREAMASAGRVAARALMRGSTRMRLTVSTVQFRN